MRKAGELPYGWLTDSAGLQRKPNPYSSVDQALRETARFYRKALWDEVAVYTEFWIEKDALSGVVLSPRAAAPARTAAMLPPPRQKPQKKRAASFRSPSIASWKVSSARSGR